MIAMPMAGPHSTDAEIDALIVFASLTDQQALQGRLGIPEHLPSGLVRQVQLKSPYLLAASNGDNG